MYKREWMPCMRKRRDFCLIRRDVNKKRLFLFIVLALWPRIVRMFSPFTFKNIGKPMGGRRIYNLKVRFIRSRHFWRMTEGYLYHVKGIKNNQQRKIIMMQLVPKLQAEFIKRLKKIYGKKGVKVDSKRTRIRDSIYA